MDILKHGYRRELCWLCGHHWDLHTNPGSGGKLARRCAHELPGKRESGGRNFCSCGTALGEPTVDGHFKRVENLIDFVKEIRKLPTSRPWGF